MNKVLSNIKNKLSTLDLKRFFRRRKGILIILVIVGFFVYIGLSGQKNTKSGNNPKQDTVQTFDSSESKDVVAVGKSFEFAAINAKKESVPVKFTIIQAERKDQIQLKGEARKPVSGFDYLLVRVEIQNDKTEKLAIVSADRIRLEIDGKLYAPDYHNGSVVIDPISIRKDLLAFSVEKKTNKFTLQVGELEGEKEKIEINF